MYANHPPFKFVFNEKDCQANIWMNKDLFKDQINFIDSQMTKLTYDVYPETMNFKIFDKIGNFIILNALNHDMLVQLFKSINLAIIVGDTESIKNQDVKKLTFTYAELKY